jgi:hypothetical protein
MLDVAHLYAKGRKWRRSHASCSLCHAAAGLGVLRSLPEEVATNIKQHLSNLDWECYRAACLLPLKLDKSGDLCLNLHVAGGKRQEHALVSDPRNRELFVALRAKWATEAGLQSVQRLSNLKDLRLDNCGRPVPIRCAFPSLRSVTLCKCTLDASGCPAIPTLSHILIMQSEVLLSRAGHPFPWISQDAERLSSLHLSNCELVDVAGTGQLHIDAPHLSHITFTIVGFRTCSTTCSLAGPQGVAPSLLNATLETPEEENKGQKNRYALADRYS